MSHLQRWFADVLRTPLQGQRMAQKHVVAAAKYIPGTAHLKPHERLEIYNQQYWWRLFGALQHILPSLSLYLGKEVFNQKIAEPYLLEYEVKTWSLYLIGEQLLPWLEKNWRGDELVLRLAKLDAAFYSTFLGEVIDRPLNPEGRFFLQPHVKLLRLDDDLLTFRQQILEGRPSASPGHQAQRVVLYRVPCTGKTFWDDISVEEEILLKAFEKGAFLEEALGRLEGSEFNVQDSFAAFASRKLLYEY